MRDALHDSRIRRRWCAVAAGLSVGSALLACSSSSDTATGGGSPSTSGDGSATTEPGTDAGTTPVARSDATTDASDSRWPDGGSDTGADAAAEAGVVCTTDAAIAIAGDYTAPDGSERWLRKTATATTYSVVPRGTADASNLPALYRVASVCSGTTAGTLALASLDGTAARLDWTNASSVSVCFRAAANTTAALALPPPDATNAATGCAGAAWQSLTKETP
jgi:hypothetical protein